MAEEKVTNTAENKAEKPVKAKNSKPSVFKRFGAWLKSVKAELKKIVWTSPSAVRTNSIMVIIAMIVFAAVTGLVDITFHEFIVILGKLI